MRSKKDFPYEVVSGLQEKNLQSPDSHKIEEYLSGEQRKPLSHEEIFDALDKISSIREELRASGHLDPSESAAERRIKDYLDEGIWSFETKHYSTSHAERFGTLKKILQEESDRDARRYGLYDGSRSKFLQEPSEWGKFSGEGYYGGWAHQLMRARLIMEQFDKNPAAVRIVLFGEDSYGDNGISDEEAELFLNGITGDVYCRRGPDGKWQYSLGDAYGVGVTDRDKGLVASLVTSVDYR